MLPACWLCPLVRSEQQDVENTRSDVRWPGFERQPHYFWAMWTWALISSSIRWRPNFSPQIVGMISYNRVKIPAENWFSFTARTTQNTPSSCAPWLPSKGLNTPWLPRSSLFQFLQPFLGGHVISWTEESIAGRMLGSKQWENLGRQKHQISGEFLMTLAPVETIWSKPVSFC